MVPEQERGVGGLGMAFKERLLGEAFEALDRKRRYCEESGSKLTTFLVRPPRLDRKKVLAEAREYMDGRKPDMTITHGRRYYLKRWWYEVGGDYRWYIHEFGADDPSDLHDHPSHSMSWCLAGKMREYWHGGWENIVWERNVYPGLCVYRADRLKHRLEIRGLLRRPAITLFAFGPKVSRWGFYKGEEHDLFVPWEEYESDSVRTTRFEEGR